MIDNKNFRLARIGIVILIILISFTSYSCLASNSSHQSTEEPWGITLGGDFWDYSLGVAVDENDGSIFLAGFVNRSTLQDQLELLQLFQSDVYFIAKFTPSGEIIWSREWTLGDDFGLSAITDIATDPQGNILILGQFEEQIVLTDENEIINLSPDSNFDLYLLKFSSNGDILWHETWPGINYHYADIFPEPNYTVSVDHSGNVFTYGSDREVRKLNPDGELEWDYYLNVLIADAACDREGNFYLIGQYYDLVTEFYNWCEYLPAFPEEPPYIDPLAWDSQDWSIVVKLDNTGAIIWRRIMNTYELTSVSLAIDDDNQCSIYGSYFHAVDLYNEDRFISQIINDELNYGEFIINFDSAGSVDGIIILGQIPMQVYDFDVDKCGNFYFAGHSREPGNLVEGVETSAVTQVGWLVSKFDAEGTFVDLWEFNELSYTFYDRRVDIILEMYGCDTIYVAGGFKGNLGLDDIPINGHIESISDSFDLYLLKIIDE